MQIFVPSPSPLQSAQYLDDKRVIKMVLESAQLLSNMLGGPYRKTHLNHPCMVWLRKDPANVKWLRAHMGALLHEYTERYGREHKCKALGLHLDKDLTVTVEGFCNATTNHQHVKDVHLAYQLELNHKWETDKRTPTWYGQE